jgi:hypothetical protein
MNFALFKFRNRVHPGYIGLGNITLLVIGYFPRSETPYYYSNAYALYYFCQINSHRFNQTKLQYAE